MCRSFDRHIGPEIRHVESCAKVFLSRFKSWQLRLGPVGERAEGGALGGAFGASSLGPAFTRILRTLPQFLHLKLTGLSVTGTLSLKEVPQPVHLTLASFFSMTTPASCHPGFQELCLCRDTYIALRVRTAQAVALRSISCQMCKRPAERPAKHPAYRLISRSQILKQKHHDGKRFLKHHQGSIFRPPRPSTPGGISCVTT